MSIQLLADRYELRDTLGSGGMARVLEGYDRVLTRRVAVKLLREDAGGPHSQERFLREARTAASFHHPNAVAVFDTGRDNGVPFIVMELIDGPTLADELDSRGQLDTDRALTIADQVLAALAAAHRRGLVHRDVKPANIMLPPDGEAKLTDFGIAKSLRDTAAGLTQAGQVFGTPKYLSPEQVGGEQATPRSDVYALGVVLYEMLAGEPPFTGENALAVALAHTEDEPPALDQARPDLDPAVVALVRRALEKDPDARFADAGEMREALRAARAGIAPAHAPTQQLVEQARPVAGPADEPARPEEEPTRVLERAPESAPPTRRRRGGRLWMWVTVVALVLLGLVLGGAWLADRVGELFEQQIETPVEEGPGEEADEPVEEPGEAPDEPVEEAPADPPADEPPAEEPDAPPAEEPDPPAAEEPGPPAAEEPGPPAAEEVDPPIDQGPPPVDDNSPGQSGQAPGQGDDAPPGQAADPLDQAEGNETSAEPGLADPLSPAVDQSDADEGGVDARGDAS